MPKFHEQLITKFDKGMTSDARSKDFRYSQLVKNFDLHTYPTRLVPYRDTESGDSSSSTNQIKAFTLGAANSTGTDVRLYGLGVVSGDTKAKVFRKDLTTNATTDLTDGLWASPANNSSSTGTSTSFDLFVYYQNRGLIYGARDGTHIWAFDPTGSAAFADTHQALTYTNIAQGLVHSKDDILYIPYDNKIAKNNAGSWTTAALTLPVDKVITSICEYGNFLAIGTRNISTRGKSVVYLWDRDSTLTTLSETIDWGTGNLTVLENLDGVLIGISYSNETFTSKLVFRQWAGGPESLVFRELISEATYTSGDLSTQKQKVDNRLYFLYKSTINATVQAGIWKVGKVAGEFAVTLDRPVLNDSAISGAQHGFIIFEDYAFISFTNAAAVTMSKTNDTASYTATSFYESLVLDFGDPSKTKKLIIATVMTKALPAAGQVVLAYKADENIPAYATTTIFTHTTDNSISHGAVNIETSGATLPQFKEIVFRIESTGGAEITGLKVKCEEIDKELA